MDCKIIEDLIMLYAEDLCSEDSKKMVEEHLKTCESCKKKLASYKKDLAEELYQDKKIEENRKEQKEQIPDNIHPFQKIKNIMWYRWIGIVVLAVVLTVVVSVTGWLSYVQIVKEPGLSSFETIADGFSAKNLCQKFADGDMDGFVDGLYITVENCDNDDLSAFLDDQKEKLTNLYNEQLKDKALKIRIEETGYSETTATGSSKTTISSCVQIAIEIEENYTLYLALQKIGSNRFAIDSLWYEPCEEENEMDKYLELTTILDSFAMYGSFTKVTSAYEESFMHIMRNLEDFIEKDRIPDYFFREEDDLLTLNKEYNAKIQERLEMLLEEKITITDCTFQNKLYDTERKTFFSYDEEKQAFITKMHLIVEDSETGNAAVLIREFEKTDIGFKMTEAETEVIGTLDERVMEQLKHLFD